MKHDLRLTLRLIQKNPGFALTIVLTLAIGIGAASTMFTVFDQVFLRPLVYEDASALVLVWNQYGEDTASLSPPDYEDQRTRTHSFSGTGAWMSRNSILGEQDVPERVASARVTPSLLPVLGVRPAMGRWFDEGEGKPGEDHVVILVHDLWKRRFGGQRIIGRSIRIDDLSYTVVGIMPPGFTLPGQKVQVLTPLGFTSEDLADDNRGNEYLTMVARMANGVDIEQAQADVAVVAASVIERVPERADFLTGAGWSASVQPVRDRVVGELRQATMLLFLSVLVVLGIACANVASLMLARSVGRAREMGIRRSLGATPLRLVSQLMIEGLVYGMLATVVGLALAVTTMPLLSRLSALPDWTPVVFAINLRIVGFAIAIATTTTLMFSLAPAIRAARLEIPMGLADESRASSTSISGGRLRSAFVSGQIALSVVLLVGCLLLVRSLNHLMRVDPGFRTNGRISARLTASGLVYAEPEARRSFYNEILDTLEASPGIEGVGAVTELPLSGEVWTGSFHIEHSMSEGPLPGASLRIASDGYAAAMGIPIVEGRWFDRTDGIDAARVVVIDRALAARYWPDSTAIGKRISFRDDEPEWREVIGVVGNVRDSGLGDAEEPHLYLPLSQSTPRSMFLVARVDGDPFGYAERIRDTVHSIDPSLPVWALRDLETYVVTSTAQPRFRSVLFSVFAGIGLLLASIGTYSVVARTMHERRREFAIRISLGASATDILLLTFAWSVRVGAGAIALGVLGALVASRLLKSMLFSIGAFDPAVYALSVITIVVCLAGATLVPARRASRIAPAEALRGA